MTTALYHRILAYNADDRDRLALSHKVWDPTPWVIDVNTGSISTAEGLIRKQAMATFCRDHWGPESWPIHDRPARWYFGGATVDGWTWLGFADEAQMYAFLGAFPSYVREPEIAASPYASPAH